MLGTRPDSASLLRAGAHRAAHAERLGEPGICRGGARLPVGARAFGRVGELARARWDEGMKGMKGMKGTRRLKETDGLERRLKGVQLRMGLKSRLERVG